MIYDCPDCYDIKGVRTCTMLPDCNNTIWVCEGCGKRVSKAYIVGYWDGRLALSKNVHNRPSKTCFSIMCPAIWKKECTSHRYADCIAVHH
jgi:hypothetical protein